MPRIRRLICALALVACPALVQSAPEKLTVKAVNPLPLARLNQTLELSAKDLAPLGDATLRIIHVKDSAGKDLLCQAVDEDGDGQADVVILQADFGPSEGRTFSAYVGAKWAYARDDFKAYGRFVRERYDDFTWENDRIAHRTYGPALETWQAEPLISSTIDIWSKRTSRLVINDWLLLDNYHSDSGEGADFYSAGVSRGVGGNGLWADGRLWVSKNFASSRVLACGPIRVLFELTYAPFEVAGVPVSEVKRISLDAGQNLDHFESGYAYYRKLVPVCGIGIKKGDVLQKDVNLERGWLTTWEPVKGDKVRNSNVGAAIVLAPALWQEQTEDKLNLLVLGKVPETKRFGYWAGFGWDQGGHIGNYEAWKTYVDTFAQGLLAPIQLTVQTP
jgi:hypothetical protein